MDTTHGRGPKNTCVKSYSRWRFGKRESVTWHLRRATLKLTYLPCDEQLLFDFF